MESNKYVFYLKVAGVLAVLAYVSSTSQQAWGYFKEWAMTRKAGKMINIIETNICTGDEKCSADMAVQGKECTEKLTKMRTDKNAPDFNSRDRRLAIGCMHKGFMAFTCGGKTDPAKAEACKEKVAKRHEKCFDHFYTPEMDSLPEGLGANMTGCLHGIMFVQDDSAGPGLQMEEVSLTKKKKLVAKPINLDSGIPSMDEINELKEHLAQVGEQRIENFNEAMDALQEFRGGAAVDKGEDVDVFDKSGDSMLRSAGINTAPAEAGDEVERVPANE